MATKQVKDFTAASAAALTDRLLIDDLTDTTKKLTLAQLFALMDDQPVTWTAAQAFSAAVTMGLTLAVTGAVTLSSTLGAGATSVTTLATSGAATLASAVVTGAATVGTTLGVTGAATLGSLILGAALPVASGGTGAATLDAAGIVQKTGTQTIAGAKTFSDAAVFSSTINTGAATLASAVVTGAATVGTTLGVTGAATLGSAVVTGAATVGTTLGVTGNFSVNTNKFTVAAASGNTVVAGTLGVTGASTIVALSATTGTFSSTLGVTGVSTLTGKTNTGGTQNAITTAYAAGVYYSSISESSTGVAQVAQVSVNSANSSGVGHIASYGFAEIYAGNAVDYTRTTTPALSGVAGVTRHGGSGTVTLAACLTATAASSTGGGVVTTQCGLFVDTQSAGATNWALYVENNNSYLNGNVGIKMIPVNVLDVTGTFGATGAATLGSTLALTGDLTASANLIANVAGKGLRVKEGGNAKMGQSTLVGGTVTVSNTSVGANSRIHLTRAVAGGTRGLVTVGTVVNATSFIIRSEDSAGSLVADTSTINWHIVEAA